MSKHPNPIRGHVSCPVCQSPSTVHRVGEGKLIAEGAVFTRQSIKKQEQQQLARLSTELRRDIASKSFQSSVSYL